MLTYRQALRKAACETLTMLAHPDVWSDLGRALRDGVWSILFLLVRLGLLLAFPLSIPLVAYLMVLDERKRAAHEIEIRAKLRRGIHQNGPSE